MFKVLIVDDEIYVVVLIQKLIDWEAFGMCVIDIAHNGRRALRLVEEKKPDLVIVNAGMRYDDQPFLDRVREFDQRVRLIVISGLGQFEYARKALRNDVEDYLLKPINKSELEESLSSVKKKLLSQRVEEMSRQELEEEVIKSRRKIQADLLKGMTAGTLNFTTEDAAEVNSQYFTSFSERGYRLFSFHVEEKGLDEAKILRAELIFEIQMEIRKMCADMIFYMEDKYAVCLCNYGEETMRTVIRYLKDKSGILNEKSTENQRSYCTICIGYEFTELSEIKEAMIKLVELMNSRVAVGIGKVIERKDIIREVEKSHKNPDMIEQTFLDCLKKMDMQCLKLINRELFSNAFMMAQKDSLLFYRLYLRLVICSYRYFSETGIIHIAFGDYEKKFYRTFLGASSHRQMAEGLYQEIRQMILDSYQSEDQYEAPFMRIIKQYIAEHYMEEIRLTTLAEQVNLNPVYFSRAFKKEENVCFLDYLHQYRIDIAKKMLMNIQYNIDEVADRSGFQNTRYFSKIFKRMVGVTPSEYRRRRIGIDKAESENYCTIE